MERVFKCLDCGEEFKVPYGQPRWAIECPKCGSRNIVRVDNERGFGWKRGWGRGGRGWGRRGGGRWGRGRGWCHRFGWSEKDALGGGWRNWNEPQRG